MADVEDIIRDMHTTLGVLVERTEQIIAHQRDTNGAVASVTNEVALIRASEHRRDGALNVLKWLMATTIGGLGAGAAVAMAILAIIARGI